MDKSFFTTRQQVYLLSVQDLNGHGLWEFCSDEECVEGQDEATLKPIEVVDLKLFSPGAYIMTADVVFADGSRETGYVYSGESHDFGCIQPHVVIDGRHWNFWLGSLRYVKNVEQTIAHVYQALGRSAESVFPLTVTSRVRMNGIIMTSTVEGFMGRDESGNIKLFR